jgi:hypothetical protein
LVSAKDIRIRPIAQKDAARIVKALHYSGKITSTSQLHLGVFLGDRCGGAMQFGPPIDKRRSIGLVEGTAWTGFLELNRMAFADWLPRNSESRALGWALRFIRKNYPQVEWVVSYSDATQCGDGTIYRASGFVLTGIKANRTMLRMPDGSVVADKTLNNDHVRNASWWRKRGAVPLPGFQLRYIYFLSDTARSRLTVPILPFDEIDKRGASMYKGKARVGSADGGTPAVQAGGGGSNPTPTLQSAKREHG